MKVTHFVLGMAAAAALLWVGRLSAGFKAQPNSMGAMGTAGAAEHASHQAAAEWTCPMHAQIRLPEFGPCPICGMDLVEVEQGDAGPRQLVLSAAAVELARISTTRVERREVTRPVRMVGKIDYDESAVRAISAWVPGRLDRMFVDYTGVRVSEGDHLVSLYSPDLSTAQEELLSAAARIKNTSGEASAFLAESSRRSYTAARGKLLLWGLTKEQVDAIEERGVAEDHIMLTSPTSGVVIDKMLDEGAYVKTGTPIYRIADLSQVWVRLDAYEQDLAWLRYGQKVSIETEALPGELIEGRISFIDFRVNERTRTAKIRVNVDNSDGRLKPGMFVRAVSEARVGSGGVVQDSFLEGKWVCPMHHEVVHDDEVECDICGMDLVLAESLGLVGSGSAGGPLPLVIPRTAALVTGKRAVVYVELPNEGRPLFEGREVVLGPRAGDSYIVLSGLEEGELVVVHGAFRLDSSMQILAKPSMMSMERKSSGHSGPAVTAFVNSLGGLYDAYFKIQGFLAGDDLSGAQGVLGELEAALAAVTAGSLEKSALGTWGEVAAAVGEAHGAATSAQNIKAVRSAFKVLSDGMLRLEQEFGHATERKHFEAHCPMAFGDGASWLQLTDQVLNPYYGDMMLECGSIENQFEARDGQ
jgi:Cu(I)/Ag(I) efflux system membrane fusion protein